MKTLLPLLALSLLTACGGQEEAPAAPVEATPTAEPTPTLAPPDEAGFREAFGKACPDAKTANRALCKAEGMGATRFTCDFALGDDEYRRYNATLEQQDGAWAIADPETACAQGK